MLTGTGTDWMPLPPDDLRMSAYAAPIVYRPDLETHEPDEQAIIDDLREVFVGMARTVADHEGHAYRAVHAKGQGLLRGRFEVLADLPAEFAQGLFAVPTTYAVIVRLSSPPAEQLPDTVSTPRAIALKVLDVQGERVPESQERASQDFLMVNGPTFTTPGPKGFLRSSKLLAATTERMPRTKSVISATMRGAERLLEAVGTGSGKIKGMGGEPQVHPLGETFHSQVPYRFGDFVAKFSLVPVSPALQALEGAGIDNSPESQREAVDAFFRSLQAPVEWHLCAQLCRDLDTMPIEDASVEWPVEESPRVAVARVVMGPQVAWEGEKTQSSEDALTFDPWHALAAHRPLGALNRARLQVMAASRGFRSQHNGCPFHEPGARTD